MTGDELRVLRRALRLTQTQFAQALGLSRENGDRTVRAWEDGKKEVSGPAAVAAAYMAQGSLDEVMRQLIPEYVHAEAMAETGDETPEMVIRLWTPRFIALVLPADVEFHGDQVWIERDVEKLCVAMWIDPPYLSERAPSDLLAEAASRFQEYTLDALDHPGN